MGFPKGLQEAIDKESKSFKLNAVSAARQELTERYRKGLPSMGSDTHRFAYIASRMPATHAVISRVLQEVRLRMPQATVKSLLDLGAGPGTGMWAACSVFPEIEKATLIEKDTHFAALGKRLASHSELSTLRSANWVAHDLDQLKILPPHDLIVLSYAAGELSPSTIEPLLNACWQSAGQFLVVIEPGTPVGFERIRTIRSHLISLGGCMVAPCPHALACPMAGGDWCHFSERVERSSFHRRIKGGSLGYEDEKFSYVVVSKTPCVLPRARVLRHPQRRSGHLMLTLCTADEGLKVETVSRRTPENYRQARNLEWGDAYNALIS